MPSADAEHGSGRRAGRGAGHATGAGPRGDNQIPVLVGTVRWEHPTARSFWDELAEPERRALAASGGEKVFRTGWVLCGEGEESSQVMIIKSGWTKISVRAGAGEQIIAVRGPGDVVGERAALLARVRSASVIALDEVRAMVVSAERFTEFLVGHPRAAKVLDRQVRERREEDRGRHIPGELRGPRRRLAWLLFELAQRRGGHQSAAGSAGPPSGPAAGGSAKPPMEGSQGVHTVLELPMSRQELADWADISLDAVAKSLRSWRDLGIVRTDRRMVSVLDLDGLAEICGAATAARPGAAGHAWATGRGTDARGEAAGFGAGNERGASMGRDGPGGRYSDGDGDGDGDSDGDGDRDGDGDGDSDGDGDGDSDGDGGDRGDLVDRGEVGDRRNQRQRRRTSERRRRGAGATPASTSFDSVFRSSLNCSIFVVDVAGFGDPQRSDIDQLAMRRGLYDILQSAFEEAGVPWAGCHREDRGDGAVIVVPPTIGMARLADPLLAVLAGKLRQYNRHASDVVKIRLRAALHAGPVVRDANGLAGRAVILAFRILDAPELRKKLADAGADLAFAASEYVYDHVISAGAGQLDPARFERLECDVKKSHVVAWVYLAGGQEPLALPRAGHFADPAGQFPPPSRVPLDARAAGALPVAAPLGLLPAEVRGRDDLLAEVGRPLGRMPWRALHAWVLAGMGGVGKSTVALEVARVARARGWRVWWVKAADTASLTGGMLEVLRELGAPEAVTVPVREGAPTAPGRAWEFLNGHHPAGSRWLLVFDGADNPAVLAASSAVAATAGTPTPADGTGWLRPDPAGMVIVTSRNRDPRVWGAGVALRELRSLDDAAAAAVLRDMAPGVADPTGRQALQLAGRLGGLPLALHLAGAYLASPFARWASFDGYHKALDSVELPSALRDIESPGADPRATIQRTWDLSLDALAADGRPQARPLLLVLSCFAAATPIPASLLRPRPLAALLGAVLADGAAGEDGQGTAVRPESAVRPDAGARPSTGAGPDATARTEGAAGPDATARTEGAVGGDERAAQRLRDGLAGLASTGLIDVAQNGDPAGANAVTVHRVVADVNRSRLVAMGPAGRAAVCGAAVALLAARAAGLDSARPADWPAWRMLVPHVNAALDVLAPDVDAGVLGRLLRVAADGTDALLRGGRLAAAEKLARAGATAAAAAGPDDPAGLAARGGLAQVLARQGRLGEAEQLYRGLLADQSRVLGEQHEDTLATRHDLAEAIGLQGRYTAADELYRGLLSDQDRVLGEQHEDTLATRHQLARMIGMQGHHAEAEKLCGAVLARRRRVLGDGHPDTLATRHSLARMIGMQGRYREAEKLYRQVLADRQRLLGAGHPDTLATRHRLARMVGLQGRYREAEQLCRQVLADRQRLLGEEHPDNLATWHRLARMLGLQGHYGEAEKLFRHVLEQRRRLLGAEHPDTLATGHRLAWLIGRQGRYGEAEELAGAVLGGRRNVLGDDHPDTLGARDTLAWLAGLRGRYGEAEQLCREVLTDRRRVLGAGHPDTLATRHDLARLVAWQGRYGEAEQLCREVLADRRRVLGADHPDTLASRAMLAWLTALGGRYGEAEQLCREVLTDRRRVLGAEHPDTLATRHDLARLIGWQGRYEEAGRLCAEVLASRQRVLGDDHPDTLAARATLAWLAAQQGRRGEAELLYRHVLAARRRVLGTNHPDTVATSQELARVIADQGDAVRRREQRPGR